MIRLTLAACLLAAPAAAQGVDPEAKARLLAAYSGIAACHTGAEEERYDLHPVAVGVPWRDEPWPLTIGLFACTTGAYNVTQVVLIDDGYETMPAALPEVLVEGRFADELETEIVGMDVIGLSGAVTVTNAEFDAGTLTLREFVAFRGLGDASQMTEWRLGAGSFVLVRQESDLTYDGESNPWVVAEDGAMVAPRPLDR